MILELQDPGECSQQGLLLVVVEKVIAAFTTTNSNAA
jgi:hypothetical protein